MNKIKLVNKKKKIIIGIAGTPGTGKTTISKLLNSESKYKTVFLLDFLKLYKLLNIYDHVNQCYLIDVNKVKKKLKKYISKMKHNIIIIDSHISYEFADYTIILRTRPDILYKRLENRNYSVKKIIENVNSESLDVILCNSYNKYKTKSNIFEIETSEREISEIFKICIEIIEKLKLNKKIYDYKPGNINWINYCKD